MMASMSCGGPAIPTEKRDKPMMAGANYPDPSATVRDRARPCATVDEEATKPEKFQDPITFPKPKAENRPAEDWAS
ncbi:hypothetical protein NW767_014609 [Fusarium falciforme]|nr:hypothetical protein NW767_014609 [Fusarium falciforme]